MSTRKTIVILALACACGPTVATPGEAGTTSGDDTLDPTTTSPTTSDPSTTLPGTSANPTTSTTIDTLDTSDDESSTTEDCGICCDFICDIPGGNDGGECDIWGQDCLRGDKCMPWANDGGKRWNAVRCSPVGDGQIGDPCTVEGSQVSGIDDCALGLLCFWVDAMTSEGTCVATCGGTEANPTCEDPSTMCVVDFEGVITLCLPTCDPLLQDCERGSCFPVGPSNYFADGFACGTLLPPLAANGEPCEVDWDCAPGSMCPTDDQTQACADGPCCTPMCDLLAADACGPDLVCTPVLPMPAPGDEDVGYCALPR